MPRIFALHGLVAALLVSWASTAAADRHALLIGINEYRNEDIPDLRGAVNDIDVARDLLISRLGFEPDDIVVLTDARATRAGIFRAFDDLVDKARADDIVYIHYSGHGSTVQDQNGDESLETPGDDKDETLMPHDARMSGIPDITDDELNAVLARLGDSDVVVALDSCYSGTGTRSVEVLTRAYREDTRVDLYRRVGTRAASQVTALTHVLLTGARDDQLALDGRVPGGSYRGFFSYALSEVLDELGTGATPLQIDEGVSEVLQQIGRRLNGVIVPEPQVEAPDLSRPLFTGARAVASRRFAVVEALPDDEVRLEDAVLLGAARGSHWGIYPPGETRFTAGEQLANVQVEYTRNADAFGRLDSTSARIVTNSRAIRLSATPPSRSIDVAIRSASSDLRYALMSEISSRLDGVRFVGADQFSPFVIELLKPEAADGAREVVLLDVAGLHESARFQWSSADSVADRLVPALLRGSNVGSVTSLSNPQSTMRVEVGIVSESATRGVGVVPAHQPGRYRIKREGEPRSHANSLMLELECDRDCYVTLVDIDSAGDVTVLFPNAHQSPEFFPDGLIRGGTRVRIPDGLDSGNAAGFHWDYREPVGVDTIHVFATEHLGTARKIRRYLSVADSGARSRSSFHDDIEALRSELVSQPRGVEVVPSDDAQDVTEVGDWTTASVTIQVDAADGG